MAWVRRVRTASGATAVQVAEYVDGRRRIVAHVGSAHSEAELGLLLEQARGLLADADQGEFDLGIEPTPRKARLVGPRSGRPHRARSARSGSPRGKAARPTAYGKRISMLSMATTLPRSGGSGRRG